MAGLSGSTIWPSRHAVFISHATPEDNALARWLALQLTARGYVTWCDVVKLLGGEDWWKDIETSIKVHSCKFLHLASNKSVTKSGVLRELDLALSINEAPNRFIVPIRVDSVAYGAFPRDLGSKVNAIDFSKGWAPGLAKLLELLAEDGVPRRPEDSRALVTDFWRTSYPAQEGVSQSLQPYTSNWFPLDDLPNAINFHHVGLTKQKIETAKFEYPTEQNGEYLVSFASASTLASEPGMRRVRITETKAVALEQFINGKTEFVYVHENEAHKYLISMLRSAWEKTPPASGFRPYELANGRFCFWLPQGFVKNDEATFLGVDGKVRRRALVGIKNFRAADGEIKKIRYWHFAIQARALLKPVRAFALRAHVVFTEDGQTPIDSSARQHSARRSQCKAWWNDDWRDRMLAAVAHIGGVSGRIRLPLGEDVDVIVGIRPLAFKSPVSYEPTGNKIVEDLPEDAEDNWATDSEAEVPGST
jgi:hypothetical protein